MMLRSQRDTALAQFQFRTTIFNTDESIKILEQFQWNCLEAINHVLQNIDLSQRISAHCIYPAIPSSAAVDRSLMPSEHLNEPDCIRHFERAFQERHRNVPRWPSWFKSTLDNLIQQSHGPFIVFLNHDKSAFATKFSRQILCSPSILNVLQKYNCLIWPWDITLPSNRQRLLDKVGPAQPILLRCLQHFHNVNEYPVLVLLTRQNDRILLLDTINGNYDFDQTRACLERTLNPINEQSAMPTTDSTSLSPGWIGGRTPGNIRRRPSFLTTFRLSRPLRAVQRPHHVSFYERHEETKEVLVTIEQAKRWITTKNCMMGGNDPQKLKHQSSPPDSPMNLESASAMRTHTSCSSTNFPIMHMSSRRAGWSSRVNR